MFRSWIVSRISLALLLGAVSQAVVAQEQSSSIEEMTIVADQTLWSLRSSTERAKKAVFSAYNEINEENKYDIECVDETPTGTIISREVCRPVFVRLIESRMTQDAMEGFGSSAVHQQLLNEEMQVLQANLRKIEAEHPELVQLTQEYHQLNQLYEEAHAELCDGKIVCWLGKSLGD